MSSHLFSSMMFSFKCRSGIAPKRRSVASRIPKGSREVVNHHSWTMTSAVWCLQQLKPLYEYIINCIINCIIYNYSFINSFPFKALKSSTTGSCEKSEARACPRLHTNTLRRPPKISEIAGRNPNQNHKKYGGVLKWGLTNSHCL